jgi:cell division protein FtsI (penicillin-binding protein 3)
MPGNCACHRFWAYSVRQVIEEAGSAGLQVEITGSGTAREQAPAPGAMVAPGTKIVVRCAR